MFISSSLCFGLKGATAYGKARPPGKPPSAQNEWGELASHHPSRPHGHQGWWAQHTFPWAPVLSSRRRTRSWVGGAGAALAGGWISPESPVGGGDGTLTVLADSVSG